MGWWGDLAFAARSLAKARAFTFVCIVALGIGMVPVIAVPYLSRIPSLPPPGVDTEGLVEVITTAFEARPAANAWSYPDYLDLRKSTPGISWIPWAAAPGMITLPSGAKLPLYPIYVSADYFQTVGVRLERGSGFENDSAATVVVAHAFWQKELNADPEILGKTILVDDARYVVSGVAATDFEGHLGGRSLFVPLERHPMLAGDNSHARSDRGKEWLALHGRLAVGVTIAQASGAAARVTSQLAAAYPATNRRKAGLVVDYHPMGFDRSQFRRIQALAFTLTGAVLLVVCLNLSGMMQVRSALRERELSIRQAIGASRWRLAWQLLSETILLAAAGGGFASLVILNAPTVLSRLSGQPIPAQLQKALHLDLSMIAMCLGICLLTSLIFGFLPALRFSQPVMISALKDDAGVGGLRAGRIHRFTAALQVAIAVPLLVLGGISLDRVRSTASADLGFASGLLYAAPLELKTGSAAGTQAAGRLEFEIRSLRENLARGSGVASATVADGLPLDAKGRGSTVTLQTEAGGKQSYSPVVPVRVQVTRVGDEYLKTMGIPLLSGRDFGGEDKLGAELVTIITKSLADKLFSGDASSRPSHFGGPGHAIGKRLIFGVAATSSGDQVTTNSGAAAEAPPTPALTIVGVTADFPSSQMSSDRAQLLVPLAQEVNLRPKSITTDESGNRLPDLMLIARAQADVQPEKIISTLEHVVRDFDPAFRRERVVSGSALRRHSMNDFLKQSAIAGLTGGVILLLSALGIYGVVGLMAAARTREIAVRVALGASRTRVLAMILFDVLKLAAPGVAVGLVLAAAVVRLNAENIGIPLSHVEWLAYVVGAGIAILVALLASVAPARRAASVQPIVAMRSE